jgi:hypothetical protein
VGVGRRDGKILEAGTARYRDADGLRFHRPLAGFLAIFARCLADRVLALALPTFNPPKRSSATAAGFFLAAFDLTSMSLGEWVIASRIWNALTFPSVDGFFFF